MWFVVVIKVTVVDAICRSTWANHVHNREKQIWSDKNKTELCIVRLNDLLSLTKMSTCDNPYKRKKEGVLVILSVLCSCNDTVVSLQRTHSFPTSLNHLWHQLLIHFNLSKDRRYHTFLHAVLLYIWSSFCMGCLKKPQKKYEEEVIYCENVVMDISASWSIDKTEALLFKLTYN